MSLKDAIERADPNWVAIDQNKVERQRREDMQIIHERNKRYDAFYKARVKSFALETNDPEVLKAYYQMVNGSNTDAYYSENNYTNEA